MGPELPARMGEWVVGKEDGTVLTCIGLGSCIGLTLLDRRGGVAGLAHVMLPEAPASGAAAVQAGKFADLAVPLLIESVLDAGGMRHRLEAVLVGGAQMFAFGTSATQDIGRRNEAAVLAQLKAARIGVTASVTGGEKGRSVRVHVPTCEVIYREAAGQNTTIVQPSPVRRRPLGVAA
jgi:chemotaxis protein CheD